MGEAGKNPFLLFIEVIPGADGTLRGVTGGVKLRYLPSLTG